MRLLFLSKRRPQGRDLATRPYGRFCHVPLHLAQRGHDVALLLLSYKPDPQLVVEQGQLTIYSESARPVLSGVGLADYLKRAEQLAHECRPDWIIGFSDTWYGILAEWLSRRHDAKSLIDAYDNFESYVPMAWPLHWIWRRALRRATAVTAAGPGLAALMSRGRDQPATVVPMAADPGFRPMDRNMCRERLGLPNGLPLVGYVGSVHRKRGFGAWCQAFRRLMDRRPEVKWVISGRRRTAISIPSDIKESIIDVGYLPDEQVPWLVNAMNAVVVINKPSSFGDYSYPTKLYEAMACRVPVVATDVEGARWVLRDHPECVASAKDPESFAERVRNALDWIRKDYTPESNWEEAASAMERVLKDN